MKYSPKVTDAHKFTKRTFSHLVTFSHHDIHSDIHSDVVKHVVEQLLPSAPLYLMHVVLMYCNGRFH